VEDGGGEGERGSEQASCSRENFERETQREEAENPPSSSSSPSALGPPSPGAAPLSSVPDEE